MEGKQMRLVVKFTDYDYCLRPFGHYPYMKMNRLTLSDSDTAHLSFSSQVKGKGYQITILVVEDLLAVIIKQNGVVVFNETVKSIDDLKIFLEERLCKYLAVSSRFQIELNDCLIWT